MIDKTGKSYWARHAKSRHRDQPSQREREYEKRRAMIERILRYHPPGWDGMTPKAEGK